MTPLFPIIGELLKQFLILMNTKESNKYLDQYLALEKKWQEEYAKPIGQPNMSSDELSKGRRNNILDGYEFQLFDLIRAINSAFRPTKT